MDLDRRGIGPNPGHPGKQTASAGEARGWLNLYVAWAGLGMLPDQSTHVTKMMCMHEMANDVHA